MSRPKKLSKTKQLQQQLKTTRAKLQQVEAMRDMDNISSQAAISSLESRLQRLVSTRFEHQPDQRLYMAKIAIDTKALRYSHGAVLEDALYQLFSQIYRTDARTFLPDHKKLLEELQRYTTDEFDHMLYPVIRQIAMEHPINEPPILSHTLFRLARRFLQYVTKDTRDWWQARDTHGAILL